MGQTDATTRKADLLAAIRRAGAEARRPYRELLRTAEDHEHLEQIAELAGRWVSQLPDALFDGSGWDEYLRRWACVGDTVVTGRWDSQAESLVRSAGDSIASGTIALVFDPMIFEEIPKESRAEVTVVRESLLRFLAWPEVFDTVVGKLVSKQLHAAGPGGESAWDLLERARSELEDRPANRVAPANVLVPLRLAVERILEEVSCRLPVQRKAERWKAKVEAVLDQASVGGMSPALAADLARDADRCDAELASAGVSAGPADGVERAFLDGLLFLSSFLSAVDTAELRPA